MPFAEIIYKIRTAHHLSQEEFASLFDVSRQSVQKWESGKVLPEINKIIKISKYFDISVDALILDNDTRISEELKYSREIKPKYAITHPWEQYFSNLMTEYTQSAEEGKDIEKYKELFRTVSDLPMSTYKKEISDILFDIVMNAPMKSDYPYREPDTLEDIKVLRTPHKTEGALPSEEQMKDKLNGAWTGRICGCMLGKTVEGIRTDELIPFLRETGNYPLHRYIRRSDLNDEILNKYKFRFAGRCYADETDSIPSDDDTNYTVLYQLLISKYGRDFTPNDVAHMWISSQSRNAYCTAERVAFCNFIKGYDPPESAVFENPFREWIGAQIRGDYFGYINPGNPEEAAAMAWRDASVSHVKNGIYGEMFVAAMIACAAVTSNHEEIIEGGLAQIPSTSRLYENISDVLSFYRTGKTQKECFAIIHQRYDEYTSHGWCHTIPNAMIVASSLLYGRGDYTKSICMAVETGFDTDCNGATVGSVLGMAHGMKIIGNEWSGPMNDTLNTTIFGVGKVRISECAQKTLRHIK